MNPLLPVVLLQTIALIFFAGWFIQDIKFFVRPSISKISEITSHLATRIAGRLLRLRHKLPF